MRRNAQCPVPSAQCPVKEVFAALAVIVGLGLLGHSPALADETRPHNIILLIGDGMGLSQITLARLVKGAPLAMDGVKTIGLVETASLTGAVTDSSAAITAMASGVKTKNKMLGVDADGKPLRPFTDDLADQGWRIGLVTTTRVTHATPGGFYAHATERSDEKVVAQQLIDSRVTVAFGGGLGLFPGPKLGALIDKKFRIIRDRSGLQIAANVKPGQRFIGLFAESHMAYELDRPDSQPGLAEMTVRAIELLRAVEDTSFFLMVEGGRIDHAGHAHDAASSARETIAFDDACAAALKFAAGDGHTLVLITADHPTGGLAISEKIDIEGLRRTRATGIKMLADSKKDAASLRAIVRERTGVELTEDEATEAAADRFDRYEKAGYLSDTLAARRGVYFAFPLEAQGQMDSTEGHEGTMVPIYSTGPGAERFTGTFDNTEIAKRVRELTAPPVGAAMEKKTVPREQGTFVK